MNVAEILRKLADVVDSKDLGPDTPPQNPVQHSDQHAELYPVHVDHEDHTDHSTMTSPMQDEIHMIKKLAGLEHGCDKCGCDPCECDDEQLPPAPHGEDADWHQNEPGVIQVQGTMDAEGAQQLADQLKSMQHHAGI